MMNGGITHKTLRVVTQNPMGKDEPVGIMTREEGIAMARESNLDIIVINAQADPPVCKIVDYSKFRYENEKKKKEIQKKSKSTEVKEVKMSYKIDTHDYEVSE